MLNDFTCFTLSPVLSLPHSGKLARSIKHRHPDQTRAFRLPYQQVLALLAFMPLPVHDTY